MCLLVFENLSVWKFLLLLEKKFYSFPLNFVQVSYMTNKREWRVLYRFDVHRNKDKIAIGPKSLTKKRKVEDRKIEIPTNFVQGKQTDRPQIKNKACTLIQPQFFFIKNATFKAKLWSKICVKSIFWIIISSRTKIYFCVLAQN